MSWQRRASLRGPSKRRSSVSCHPRRGTHRERTAHQEQLGRERTHHLPKRLRAVCTFVARRLAARGLSREKSRLQDPFSWFYSTRLVYVCSRNRRLAQLAVIWRRPLRTRIARSNGYNKPSAIMTKTSKLTKR